MNLKDIRNAIFSQADWAPTQSTDAIDRVNAFINRAYAQMAEEAPFLFFEDTLHFATLPDVVDDGSLTSAGGPVADSLTVNANDPYVLERSVNGTNNGINWRVDDYWNGRMLEIEKTDGTKVRRLIRDIWNTGGRDRISLYQPWPNTTDTDLVYRIFNQAYYLPDDVIEVNTVRLYSQNEAWPLEVCSQYEAEMLSFKDVPKNVVAGIPRVIYRDAHFQLETPTSPPEVSVTGSDEIPSLTPWLGPDPSGEFKYLYTYAWGYRDGDSTRGGHIQNFGPKGTLLANQTAPAARPIPRWESGPSPAATITGANGFGGIAINTPNLDFMQGFGRAADARYQHGGWRKRIYRQRVTIDKTVPGGWNSESGQFDQETPDTYFLLADIPAHQVTFIDQGLVVPDYHSRLREVHGYQAIRMYPRPDKRYEVEVRCTRRPPELRDDSDVPLIHKDAINSLVQKSIALVYEAQGNMDLADRSLSRYERDLFTLTKRYGDLRYPGVPLLRRPARAPSLTGSRKVWRRWYNLPNS